jgi:hypothetical protein
MWEMVFVVVQFLLLASLLAVWSWWRPSISSVVAVILTIEAVAVLCHWGRTNFNWRRPLNWKRPERPADGTNTKQVYAVQRTTKIV